MNEILKHSLVYGAGHVLLRVGSLAMLPITTRWLTPQDFGTIAILDLTSAAIAFVVGGGISAAVSREHFATTDERERSKIWWTGLSIVVICCTCGLSMLWLARQWLTPLLLEVPADSASLYLSIMLPHTGIELTSQVAEQRFRVVKRSQLVVGMSLVRLLVNMALNIYLLVWLEWGVVAVLVGNLLTSIVFATAWCGLLARDCPVLRFESLRAKAMIRFGAPLVLSGLATLVMHQADRYFLLYSRGEAAVGVYSLGYLLPYSLAMLLITSFSSIWAVKRFEIAAAPDGDATLARMFEIYMRVYLLATLALSLFAPLALRILASEPFRPGVAVVPIVALGYAFYAARMHFETPLHVARRTAAAIPMQVLGVGAALALYALLIPRWGGAGAAWATLVTFAFYASGYYLVSRRVKRIAWPIGRVLQFMVVCVAAFLLVQAAGARFGIVAYYLMASAVLATLSSLALRGMLRDRSPAEQNTTDGALVLDAPLESAA